MVTPHVTLRAALAIRGWMSEEELGWLAENAQRHRVIVEVGSFLGRSTRALGDHCPGVVHAVDPWPDEVAADDVVGKKYRYPNKFIPFQQNLDDLIVTGKVIPHRTTFREGLFPPASVDMVFIDGNHSYEAVMNDIRIARGVIEPGGLLCGHDYSRNWPGVVRAVDEAVGGENVNIFDSIWVSMRG